MTTRILVTGGAGYIGSILVPTLLADGHQVTVIDSMFFRQTSLLDVCAQPRFAFVRGDARDASVVTRELAKHDVVIPLAAVVGAPACDRDPSLATTLNLDAVRLIAGAISRDQLVIYPTTNSGYGIGQDGIYCDEKTPLRPVSLYGRTKVDAEQLLLDSGRAVTLRLATVFGASPRMRMDLLVNDFVYRALTDRSIVLFDAHFKRNYIHIRDVAGAFQFALAHADHMRGEPYNVGLSDANLSKRELCLEIQKQLPRLEILEAPTGEDPDKRNYIVSNAKLEALGWRPQYSLALGIDELIKVYRILSVNPHGNV